METVYRFLLYKFDWFYEAFTTFSPISEFTRLILFNDRSFGHMSLVLFSLKYRPYSDYYLFMDINLLNST